MRITVLVFERGSLEPHIDYTFDDADEQSRRAFARRAKDAWEAGQVVTTFQERGE